MDKRTLYPGPGLPGEVRPELERAVALPFVILPVEPHVAEIVHQPPCPLVGLDEAYAAEVGFKEHKGWTL